MYVPYRYAMHRCNATGFDGEINTLVLGNELDPRDAEKPGEFRHIANSLQRTGLPKI